MAFNFPDSPTVGQIVPGPSGAEYEWDGVKWSVSSSGGGGGGIEEAPNDGTSYGRKSLAWSAVLPLAGGTLVGALTLSGAPSIALHAATKAYVDANAGGGGIVDAPADGIYYTRRNNAWASWGTTVWTARSLAAGAGLTGGGDLSADRTFAVGAGTGITVNADDVALTVPVVIANGGTSATTAAAAFVNLKQNATTGSAGVARLATDAEVRASSITSAVVMSVGAIETASAFVALTDVATVAVDWDAGINFSLTVAGNRIIGNPTNGAPGTFRTIVVQGNDATARTITFDSQFLGALPTITDCTSTKWYLLTIMCITTTHFVVTSVQAK
jgi:hypothetical protein